MNWPEVTWRDADEIVRDAQMQRLRAKVRELRDWHNERSAEMSTIQKPKPLISASIAPPSTIKPPPRPTITHHRP